jgi:hypothetical protein
MELKLIMLQFCAHLFADFIFQSQEWSNHKRDKIFSKYLFSHIFIVGFLSWLFSFDPGFWKAALTLSVLHFFTDMLKNRLVARYKKHFFFFADQVIHLIALIVVSVLYARLSGISFLFEPKISWIAIFTGFVLCAKPANIIIKYVFQAFSIKIPDNDTDDAETSSLPNAGKLIGISERFIVLALSLTGQFQAIGLLIAAKSILRFNTTSKSEYVLVGTLLSFGIALFTGILINLLI